MKLEHYSSLAIRLADKLRQQLEDGGFEQERLPSEQELASSFGVSRATVRQALSLLEQEGMIIRRHGSGTYLNEYVLRIDARAETAYEFTELLKKSGYDPSIEKITIEKKPLGVDAGEALERNPEETGLWVEKLFLANGEPAILCLDIFPEKIIKTASYPSKDLEKPIFDFLESHCDTKISYILSEIVPQVADNRLMKFFNMETCEPLLLFKEIGFDEANQPILKSRVNYRDDFIRFSLLRTKK